MLEVGVDVVVGIDETVATVEDGDHEHAQAEHVTGHAAHRLVLNLGSCVISRKKNNLELELFCLAHFKTPLRLCFFPHLVTSEKKPFLRLN